MKTILVTGGAGFIGSHCVDRLLQSGHQVVVFDKQPPDTADNLQHCMHNITYHCGDLSDMSSLKTAMTGCDAVLHLAAFVSVPGSIQDPAQSFQDNVVGTFGVFECMRQLGISRGVYASSAAVYGDPATVPTPETSPLSPLSPYGLHKQQNEQWAAQYNQHYDMSLVGLRFFNVYGTRQDPTSPYSGVISIFVKQVTGGDDITIYGDGSNSRDFVYVGDVAQVCEQALLQGPPPTICNVGTGTASTLVQLLDAISAQMNTDVQPTLAAPRTGDIAHSCADITMLQDCDLPTPQTPLATGLRKMMES